MPIRTPFRADAFREGPGRSDHPEEILQGNADLIAAAPALLAALEKAVNLYTSTKLLAMDTACGQWINEARAALKEAKGE